jgi:hypothetical protein
MMSADIFYSVLLTDHHRYQMHYQDNGGTNQDMSTSYIHCSFSHTSENIIILRILKILKLYARLPCSIHSHDGGK